MKRRIGYAGLALAVTALGIWFASSSTSSPAQIEDAKPAPTPAAAAPLGTPRTFTDQSLGLSMVYPNTLDAPTVLYREEGCANTDCPVEAQLLVYGFGSKENSGFLGAVGTDFDGQWAPPRGGGPADEARHTRSEVELQTYLANPGRSTCAWSRNAAELLIARCAYVLDGPVGAPLNEAVTWYVVPHTTGGPGVVLYSDSLGLRLGHAEAVRMLDEAVATLRPVVP